MVDILYGTTTSTRWLSDLQVHEVTERGERGTQYARIAVLGTNYESDLRGKS